MLVRIAAGNVWREILSVIEVDTLFGEKNYTRVSQTNVWDIKETQKLFDDVCF